MKRTVALLLALFILASACALGEGSDRFGKYDEPVTITYLSLDNSISTVSGYDSSNPDRKSIYENAWITGIEEYMNIRLERIIAEDENALAAKVGTGIAADNLPDIMQVSKDLYYVLAENGCLQDLSETYEAYKSEYGDKLIELEEAYPDILNTAVYNGEFLGYCKCDAFYTNTHVLWVRQDWLNKVDKEIPTTIDELADVAQAFVDNKLGGENTVGIEMVDIGSDIMAAYGAVIGVTTDGSMKGAWQEQDDGTWVYGMCNPNMREALLKEQEFYANGLIKSDFAVAGTLEENIANGVCGLLYSPTNYSVQCMQTCFNNDPDADWVPVHIPTLDGERVQQYTNAGVNVIYCVSKACEHPEALFMLVEFSNAMRFADNEEESHRFNVCEDDYQMWNLDPFRDTVSASSSINKGKMIREGFANGTPVEEMDALARSNYELCLKGANGEREFWGRYLNFTVGQALYVPLIDNGYLIAPYNGPTSETMSLYWNSIDEALQSAMIKVIMGEDISVYDKAVEEWYNNGGQIITDEVTSYYQQMK